MRLIDADALEDSLGVSDEDIIFGEMLQYAHTIDPVRHGKWIDGHCEFCGAESHLRKMPEKTPCSPFCWNCGAKMDLEDKP